MSGNYTPPKATEYALLRPYAVLTPTTPTRRLFARVKTEDWVVLASLYPVPGAVESILTTLLHGITNEFRRANITSWSSHNQRTFIAHIRRCASLGVVVVPVSRDDAGESPDAGGAATQLTQEPTEALLEADGGNLDQEVG